MKNESREGPTLPVVCGVIGGLTIPVGAVAMLAAALEGGPLQSFTGWLIALAVCGSSVLWFAVGRVITLLAQIAHNTRRE